MANRRTSAAQRRAAEVKKQKEKRKSRYIRRTAIVMLEVVMIGVLGICCYGVSLLNGMSDANFRKDEIYLAPLDQPEIPDTSGFTLEVTSLEELESWVSEAQTEAATEETDAPTPEETVPETPAPVTVDHGEDEVLAAQNITNGFWNILLVGTDARNQAELTDGHNSDTMIVCSINVATKEIKLASIYRDTLMKMYSDGKYDKANAELAKSNYQNMLSMLNMNLDLRMTDVILVNWAVLANYINAIGGIWLDITPGDVEINPAKEHTAVMQGYITEIVRETGIPSPQIEQAGYQLCNGVWAVAYCRNRYTVDNDYERTARQREVIGKVMDRTKELVLNGDFGVVLKALTEACSNVLTNMIPADIFRLAMYITNFNIVDTCGFPFDKRGTLGTYLGVADPVVPIDFGNNVIQLHRFLFGEDGYSPSAVVQEISYTIRQATGF